MRNIFSVILFVLAAFWAESLCAEFIGRRWTPNLLIILIVFFNLFRGIRYSLLTAILAGLLRDSYTVSVFGLNLFSFVVCGYMTTIIKVYIYHPGSTVSRVLIVFLICLINLGIQIAVREMFAPVDFLEALRFVVLPEVVITTLLANTVFETLKKCALRLFA